LVAASQKQRNAPSQSRRSGESKPKSARRPTKGGGFAAALLETLWRRGILTRAAIGVVILAGGIFAYHQMETAAPPTSQATIEARKPAAATPLPPQAPAHPAPVRSIAAPEEAAPPATDKVPPRRKLASQAETTAPEKWFMQAYLRCWTPPSNAPRSGDYAAKIRVVHDSSGSLAANPVLVNPPNDPDWRPYAESALQAVKKCNPLTVPSEYQSRFDEWRKLTLYFQPGAAEE
jgi:hypothetical protein